ncbi:MAG TPA: DUF5715 family protein [Terriglobus sp.]
MTAIPNGTVSRSLSVRAVAFALAATLLPSLSHAATHRPAAKHGTTTHAKAAAKPASTKSSHRNTELERAAATTTHKATKVRAAKADVVATKSTKRDAIEAARVMVHGANAVHANPIPMPETVASRKATPAGDAADRATQDRVHAWYKTRNAAATADQTVADAAPEKPAPTRVKAVKAVATPDLSPVPHKATVEDFDRALQQQRQVIQAAQQQDQARTTDADDAAEAATQIPRTAPTARVAAPFVHGDLLTQQAAETQTASLDEDAPANPTAPLPTAQSAPAKAAAARAIIIRREPAPAVAAVKSAAKKPELDTETAQALTDATFDDDAPSADKPAPTLVAKTAPVKRAVVASDDDVADAAVIPAVKVDLYDTRGHLKMLPAMKGSHEILVHQNQMAAADGLDRIEDDDQLRQMRRYKLLVSLPDNEAIMVNDAMPSDRRYARPWAVRFLNDLARAHYARFHTPLVITSAVRTVEFQKHLVRINGNAAPPTGDVASPHLYGQAIDLGKRGMSMTEIAWMRAYLTPVESAGKIDVEEEFQQACFHISVYRRYLGLPQKKNAPVPDALPQRKMELVKASPAPSKRRRHISALLAAGVR